MGHNGHNPVPVPRSTETAIIRTKISGKVASNAPTNYFLFAPARPRPIKFAYPNLPVDRPSDLPIPHKFAVHVILSLQNAGKNR